MCTSPDGHTVLILQTLYALSDEQIEYQLKDRLSFMRFVGLALHEPVPDATTVWLFREPLVQAEAIKRLFARLGVAVRDQGLLARGAARSSALRRSRPARPGSRARRRRLSRAVRSWRAGHGPGGPDHPRWSAGLSSTHKESESFADDAPLRRPA
jgi:transposase, IS5 family